MLRVVSDLGVGESQDSEAGGDQCLVSGPSFDCWAGVRW